MNTKGTVEYLNPDELNKNPAFSNVIVTKGMNKTVYIGGQNAVTANGEITGKSDIKVQTAQVLKNIQIALNAAGVRLEHVIKWNIYVVQGQPMKPAFEEFQKTWGDRPNPPAITLVYIAALAHPDFLLEMDAIAVVPE